jgi:amino acid adenylation domain-containing protein
MENNTSLLAQQSAVRAKCFHPTGTFIEFRKEEIEQSLVSRFEQQVRKQPNRLAVKTKTQQLTYEELNQAANRTAEDILAQRGAGQEPIALLLPKGAPLVVAILGTLKAGKICMPMDPTLPQARLSYMLEDAQANLIVTNRDYLAMAKTLGQQRHWLDIDEPDNGPRPENPNLILPPDAFAYIFYTSGSTGLPKGVSENHRNLLHHIMTETNDLHFCAEDRLTLLASSGRDIFRALLNGGAVYPVDIKQEGLAGLARWLIQEQITVFTAVASAFRHFVNALTGDEQFPHLRLIKLIGESVYRSDVQLYQKYFSPHCILVNSYGPNETGHLSHYLVDKETRITTSTVPVGYAVEDKEVVLFDEDGKEVKVGQTGEIVVRSHHLSPGYWRRPDLTSAAFSPSSEHAERLYRTGDLGSMQSDGCLTHLGRKDFQVKIRGYRVEIAEVEMALLDLDGVKEAVVVAREDVPGHKRLIAYIVPTGTPAPTTSEYRSALAAKLPDYMIPSVFVLMDSLPLIGIGKVDRRALPAPGRARPKLANPYVAPRTPIEAEVCQIWTELLDLEQVGIEDPFLDLGGHSLLATRIVSRLRETFHIEVPLQTLLEAATVAEMALLIVQHQAQRLDPAELASLLAAVEETPEKSAE